MFAIYRYGPKLVQNSANNKKIYMLKPKPISYTKKAVKLLKLLIVKKYNF